MNVLSVIRDVDHHETQLRRVAKKVKNPKHPSIRVLLDRMIAIAEEWEYETGRRCEGLAAPQIGVNLQVVILRKTDEMTPRNPDRVRNNTDVYATESDYLAARKAYKNFVHYNPHFKNWHELINPRFISSEGAFESDEGCLSVPGVMGKVVRPAKVIFEYTDARGHRVGPLGTSDRLSAAVVTHEIDHLMGRLFLDNSIFTLPEDEYTALLKSQAEDKAAKAAMVVEGDDAARLAEMVETPPEPTEALKELLNEETEVAEA